jgi:hypothetical protein
MGETLERFAAFRSRFTLGDQKTQLTLASIAASIVLVAALIALPSSKDNTSAIGPGGESVTEDLVEGRIKAKSGDRTPTDGSGPGGRSSGAISSDVPLEGAAPEVPPITDKQIKVGLAYTEDPGAANEAAGFTGIGQVDQRRAYEAVIAHINRDPPFGRKLVPVWYATSTNEIVSKGGERLEQEACELYTKDNPVFMVWGNVVGGDVLNACLKRAGIPLVGVGTGESWRQTYKDYPYLVSPTSAALDRMAEFYVDRLYAQDFFSEFKSNELPYTPQKPADGKPRIGLIRYDQPSYEAASAALKKRLAAHGLALCDGCEFEVTYSGDDVGEQLNDATEVNAAIQNCKGRPQGACTHMLFLGSTAGLRIALFWVEGAEKQNYRPRLGLNPLDGVNTIKDTVGEDAYEQYRQSMLVTWDPIDFGGTTPAFSACKKIIQDAGETFEGDEGTNKEGQIPLYCDEAWYTVAVLEAAGRTLTLATFMNGVHTMTPVPSASTYLMQTKPGRHDGAGAIRIGEFFDDCNCFKPTTPVIPV